MALDILGTLMFFEELSTKPFITFSDLFRLDIGIEVITSEELHELTIPTDFIIELLDLANEGEIILSPFGKNLRSLLLKLTSDGTKEVTITFPTSLTFVTCVLNLLGDERILMELSVVGLITDIPEELTEDILLICMSLDIITEPFELVGDVT